MLIASYVIELIIYLSVIVYCITFNLNVIMLIIMLAVTGNIFSLIQQNLK